MMCVKPDNDRARDMAREHPYRGRRAAIATLHGKERVIGPALSRFLALRLEPATDVDTDSLGTFTGEIARAGSMLDAARAKARLAMARTGAGIGLGSEGAFGPHPAVPFLASGVEVVVLIDGASGQEIVAQRRTRTNYESTTVRPGDDLSAFLERILFPSHAVIVRPERGADPFDVVKGVSDRRALGEAVAKMAAASDTGRALVQTDMRAHLNPTRMKAIGFVARALALRAARLCPACGAPGFGVEDVLRGLPCADCGAPTRLVRAELHRCRLCGFETQKRVRPASLRAEAKWCDLCNP
jgi:predicted Zn-ribbon and HTH transcriptional regulator